MALVGLMRCTQSKPGVPGVVILSELEVSTTSGIPCRATTGMTARVEELPHAPMMIGTCSRVIKFSAAFADSWGSFMPSRMMGSRGLPQTPPWALIFPTPMVRPLTT